MVDRDQQMRRAHRADRRRQRGELLRIAVVAAEQYDAADQGWRKHVEVFGAEFGSGDIDHERTQAHAGFSNTAIDSTCVVCGNMSITPAPISLNPWSFTKIPASRAKLPGWQEIYTTRRGRQCAMRAMHRKRARARRIEQRQIVAVVRPGSKVLRLEQIFHGELGVSDAVAPGVGPCFGDQRRIALHAHDPPARRASGSVKFPRPQNKSSTASSGLGCSMATAAATMATLTSRLTWMKSAGPNSRLRCRRRRE